MTFAKRRWRAFIFAACMCGVALSPLPAAAIDIEALVESAGLGDTRVGFHVVDLETGKVLSTRNATATFIPASTAKIVTAAAALGILGIQHRFRTSLFWTGALRGGVLHGDLYLKGTGDPLLFVQDLMVMLEQLRDAGLRRVRGRFFYDETALPRIPRIEPTQTLAAAYNGGVSALSLEFNRTRVFWQRTSGDIPRVIFSPLDGIGRVTAAGHPAGHPHEAGQPFVPAPGDGENWFLVPRHLKAGRNKTWLPLRDPGRYTAMVFRALAARVGITAPAPEAGAVPAAAIEVAAVESQPLFRTLRGALNYSNNLVNELIGLAAARKLGPTPESLAQSSARLVQWLVERTPGLDRKGLVLPNHSGLSVQARVTPQQMQAFMRQSLRVRYGQSGMLSVLPLGGWGGSMSGRFWDPALAGRIFAKTGTMSYVSGIVGVFYGRASGRPRGFALYTMNDRKRNAYDANPDREGGAATKRSDEWTQAARDMEENLLGQWVRQY
jgi:D-alanyl-D-alanine carboxypeptidase/D-alanyl-D-alanine-endopeptidase (penicillin-binding protein 4)